MSSGAVTPPDTKQQVMKVYLDTDNWILCNTFSERERSLPLLVGKKYVVNAVWKHDLASMDRPLLHCLTKTEKKV